NICYKECIVRAERILKTPDATLSFYKPGNGSIYPVIERNSDPITNYNTVFLVAVGSSKYHIFSTEYI
ncbi:MAG: hypothetical protein COS14_03395, partial [Bacteroidetes bacterium CG02_land_8_20_14_3_00_31_25]